MKCEQLQQRIDDYLDGDLDSILVSMLEEHVGSCENCAQKVELAKSLQFELKQIGQHQISEEFISSAFSKVKQHYPESKITKKQIGIKTGFVTALAAGFALWAVLTTFILPTVDSNSTNVPITVASAISTLNLKVDQTKVVRLSINTPENFDKVTLSVILPTHVELKGHKNKRKVSWESKLAKGKNILRIPLRAIDFGQGEFIARISHNGKVKTFKLFLKSLKPDLSHIHTFELQV